MATLQQKFWKVKVNKLTYVIDIDGTICSNKTNTKENNYNNSQPIKNRIEKINSLYDEGHKIVYMRKSHHWI